MVTGNEEFSQSYHTGIEIGRSITDGYVATDSQSYHTGIEIG